MKRIDGRSPAGLRPISIELGVQRNPEGSVLYRCGDTSVLISASLSDSVPDWMKDSGSGWLTAEYAMHPRANPERKSRDGRKGRVDGRSTEIQRLIGRSLRAAIDLEKLGPLMITLDCDVLDADGGTRTASISGGFVALALALDKARREGMLKSPVLRVPVAAVSVGLLEDQALLDLCYAEDRDAEVDLNVVAAVDGRLIEVQGTAEGAPFPRAKLDAMLDLSLGAMNELGMQQRQALESADVSLEALCL